MVLIVSEPATQHLISDLKEQFMQQKAPLEDTPVSSFKASLDIPGEFM